MAWTATALKVAIGLLMVDSIIELSFISSMVAWLHFVASGTFTVAGTTPSAATFNLAGKPANLMVDQGHTSNGASGTAFVLIGIGGILALWLRTRDFYYRSRLAAFIYNFWVAAHIPALLLTVGALAYVFAVTNQYEGQTIDVGLAASLQAGAHYPVGTWTPQNWFSAVLTLNLADPSVRADILSHYRVMRGWQYNLIPMLVIQLAETVFAILDFMRRRREIPYGNVDHYGQAKA